MQTEIAEGPPVFKQASSYMTPSLLKAFLIA
jgi:hypothetical protein